MSPLHNQVYHVTPSINIPSIRRLGINPVYAQGDLARVYFVPRRKLWWAIFHVAERHSVTPAEITLCRVIDTDVLKPAFGKWYFATVPVWPHSYKTVLQAIESRLIARPTDGPDTTS